MPYKPIVKINRGIGLVTTQRHTKKILWRAFTLWKLVISSVQNMLRNLTCYNTFLVKTESWN